jgi:spore coat protein H
MKSALIILSSCILLNISSEILGATSLPDSVDLRFPEIKIYISKNQYLDLQSTNGEKIVLSKPVMLINQTTVSVKEIHARGNNSLKFKRKSLSVELDKGLTLAGTEKKIHLKKFNLLNLSMDKHLWHNRWSNLKMKPMGLFPLFNSYCTVWINDQPQGIFLLVEKPQQEKAQLKSPYMLRRGPGHTISDEYFEDEDKDAAKKYRKQFHSIYSGINTMDGAVLVNHLEKIINLDNYLQYIAFNYLVMNGDYADEVFLYIDPETQLFKVISWDYDDILRPFPHEGLAVRNKEFADKRIFSLEESLDRAIAGNAELYSRYEQVLKKVLVNLDSTSLTESAWQVINELEQLSSDKSMTEVTLFLDKNPFDFVQAKEDILLSLKFILNRRKWILQELK